jgi:magnesium chelatase subunit H
MTQKRTSAAEVLPIRVVIVTLDGHLASAAGRASEALGSSLPGLVLSLHAATEWADSPDALARCKADIAAGDIVIVSMLFMEEHIRPVLADLAARRDSCDAMVCCMAAPEVTRLTRMGRFDMMKPESGFMALLKRLRGKQDVTKSAGAQQMAMLRRLPQLLRFIPGTAQDVRAYFLTLQCWLAGSADNVARMVHLLVQRYADGPRAALRALAPPDAPLVYPEVGVYHPRMAGRFGEDSSALPRVLPENGRVGLLLMRSYLLAGNTAHYDAVIAALEAQGLSVVPAFASGLDARPAAERHFMQDGRASVDAVLSLTGFSLVGGPAYNDAKAAEALLRTLDVPYLAAHAVEFQSLEQWQSSEHGLTPVEATMMVAIPELDGATGSMVFGGRSSAVTGPAQRDLQPHTERIARLASRVARLVALRRVPVSERKVGIVLFNFPPNAGSVGSAAFLDVFASLFNTLKAMQGAGYRVEVPADVDALRERILGGNSARFGSEANVLHRVPTDEHVRRETWLAEIERTWGPAPGRVQSDGTSVHILGARFGNVLVGVQPAFGHEGDPMRLLFDRSFAPTHAFSAFYRYLREDFAADVALHFGTHGALEFMPGKQVGLSGTCWPDRLLADLPNVYLYAANNPSEASLAKRRAAATTLTYLTPPVATAGLYRDLLDLKGSLERWRGLPATAGERQGLAELIQTQAAKMDLVPANAPSWGAEADREIGRLAFHLHEYEHAHIPFGLHVVGQPPSAAERAETLAAMASADGDVDLQQVDALLAQDHELPALLRALDGRFIPPAPGGDLLRNPAVLPTGRNLHAFDPFRIPSAFALAEGARHAAQLLARHQESAGALPGTIALVLWGSDNLKSEGTGIGQALALIGARPRFDHYGRLIGASLIPLPELGRPRIDVVVTLSGIFRDLMPLQTRLLAEAAYLAASAEEPLEQNFVRQHTLAYCERMQCDFETAALRVFSNADGAYGANVTQLVQNGLWQSEDELAETYSRRKCFAYNRSGRARQSPELLAATLQDVDLAYQNLDSVEVGVTSLDQYFDTLGGITRAVKRATGESVPVYIADQTSGKSTVRTLAEQVALETRTRVLNPKWYEGMLRHGYEGVHHIENHVTNTMGWSATTGQVAPWVYQQITDTYVLDDAMRNRLARLNPKASARVAHRLLEAHQRQYWAPDAATLAALQRASEELEDRLEGVGLEAAA